jgi:hypothetical protein
MLKRQKYKYNISDGMTEISQLLTVGLCDAVEGERECVLGNGGA